MSKCESGIAYVSPEQFMVATMLRGTSDSSFTLLRGVPSNCDGRADEYMWTEVLRGGKPVTLSLQGDNPLQIDMPGAYKFRNDGTDDEQALIDMTVYKKKVD